MKILSQPIDHLKGDELEIVLEIREEIKKLEIPYWKNFDKEFEKEKILLEERLRILGGSKGFEITDVSSVYDRKRKSEGIKVEWKFCGKEYTCQEFIKQRIVDE